MSPRGRGSAPSLAAGTLAVAGWSCVLFALAAGPALAHAADGGADAAWNTWSLTPDIVIPTLLIVAVYVAGALRRTAGVNRVQAWRHVAFASGMAAVFLALELPVDGLADHLFSIHQIQHLLLRMIGPMLIALSAPQALLISGLPSGVRRGVLAPILANTAVQGIFSMLTRPVTVTVIFIAALYVWEVPRFHNAAILSEPIHYTMHITMLAAGLLFWWRIFDVRPAPTSTPYGTRLMMLWVVTLSNIVLGAFTTLKTELLYPAYDVAGRLFGMRPLADESIGGFVIWVPGSMMCLAAIIIVINLWGRHEDRMEATLETLAQSGGGNSAHPTTGAALVAGARVRNRTLAVGFAMFALVMFAAAILIAVLNHVDNSSKPDVVVHAPTETHSAIR